MQNMQFTPYLYDLALVAIILICTLVSGKKGILDAVFKIAGWVISLILVLFLAPKVAGYIGDQVTVGGVAVPVTGPVASILILIGAGIVLSLIFGLIQKLVDKIPIVGTINHLLGAVLGLVLGLLGCYIMVSIAAIVILASRDTLPWLNSGLIDQTLLVRFIYSFNILHYIPLAA